ncbi:GntR family transcriptional regulator [Collinsella sp. An268]|uniref:GntR family transcriptional regulator n=1 Tax=Collinsella sp. An268 TaxID=1965612 RepID=UPI000B3AC831|nr:GntR family transcriptional regulator [Collinsella sp. An268]OUO65185.1 hypothetical protein B5F70_00545 [Collinsella sp. An268]
MGTPKYIQIENALRSEIESGRFESGDLFYSNAELIDRFGASSITVIHAVNDLVNEGMLVRYQGKGTFVFRSRLYRPVRISENGRFLEGGEKNETRVLGISFPEGDGLNPEVVSRLGLSGKGRYAVIERVRLFDGVPYQHQVSYIPRRFIKQDVDPSYYESVYRRLREDHGLFLSREASHEVTRIVMPADGEVRSALSLAEAEPCVRKERCTTLPDGTVAEYVVMHRRWDYFEQTIDESAH